MNRSLLIWIAIPVAIALGAFGGVVATQKMMTKPPLVPLALANPPDAPAVVPPPAVPVDRSPVDVYDPFQGPADTNKPMPPRRAKRTPFDLSESDPKPPSGSAKEPEPATEPEMPSEPDPFQIPEFNPPPGYFDLPAPNKNDGTDPPIIKNGQVLTVEVLEALPGRPINGVRVVRPDGTISLGFYGDLRVAGLNRNQAKVKLIEHLRGHLMEEVLGLWRFNQVTKKHELVPPVESNRVFIDESANYFPGGVENAPKPSPNPGYGDPLAPKTQIDQLREEISKLRKELEEIREEHKSPKTEPPVAASKPG